MKMNKSLGFVLGLCAVVSIALVSFKFADKPFGGLALYTVRTEMGKDARATLKAVADAGYVNMRV